MKMKGFYAFMLVTLPLGGAAGCMSVADDPPAASTGATSSADTGLDEEELGHTGQALVEPAQPPPPPPDGGTKPPPPPPPHPQK